MPIESVIDRYCQAWSDPDPERRRALLGAVWADGATYTDPTVHAVGAAALLDHIANTQQRRPGGRVVRTSTIELHHDVARFEWHAVLPDGSVIREGVDIAILDTTGRIERMIGFFGPLPKRS
jgi:hypothetical protein